ncbi:MAG: hypothetical protein ACPGLY_05955 [Rubripirellula sp.]
MNQIHQHEQIDPEANHRGNDSLIAGPAPPEGYATPHSSPAAMMSGPPK